MRAPQVANVLAFSIAAGYVLLLCFPQALFAHEVTGGSFCVYSNEPPDRHLHVVLERAESLLARSPIRDRALTPRVFLLGSTTTYWALSLSIGGDSFGKSFMALPPENVFLNAHDLANDLVFRGAAEHNVRSLSGVLAHEVTHLLVRRRFGYWRNLAFPSWKKEGYAEYVAGGSTLSDAAGVKMWKENPEDASGYRYFKNYRVVKYLLEHEGMSVEDLFDREIDFERVADVVRRSL